VIATDLVSGCVKQIDSVFVSGSYSDPRFQLIKTDVTCAGNDGTISTQNLQKGRAPFTYTIVAPSAGSVGASSASGSFTGLTPGEYSIQLQDSCGGIQVRKITIDNYSWSIDKTVVTKTDCENAKVAFTLKDSKGNTNLAGTAFDGFAYGVVLVAGDTSWSSNYDFAFLLGKLRRAVLVAKDGCGKVKSVAWNVPAISTPTAGTIASGNYTCTTFSAIATNFEYFTNPEYCLYNDADVQIDCNSTGVFTDLAFGTYCLKVTDVCYDTVVTKCFVVNRPAATADNSVQITEENCTTFTATISGQQYLYSPVTYTLKDDVGNFLEDNSTGIFTDLPYGDYCIDIHDGCSDTTFSRCFTATKPVPVLTTYNINNYGCSTFSVAVSGDHLVSPRYCLYDNEGNLVTCNDDGLFTGIVYGDYCIKAISCSDTSAALCFSGTRPVPGVGPVTTSNKLCSTFDATITGQANLTDPEYCLYKADGTPVSECNETGVFTMLPYGAYYIEMRDGCTDTVIRRDFEENQKVPAISTSVTQSNSTCTGFTAKVTGTNLTSPTYSVYNSLSELVATNDNGTFTNLVYGSYCFEITDGCKDTTMQVCKTFAVPKGISLTATKNCTIGSSNVKITFTNTNAPFRVQIFTETDALIKDTTTNVNPATFNLPDLLEAGQYKITGTDGCGQVETAMIDPDAFYITKSVSVKAKCPGSSWENGSGEILANCGSNWNTVTPKIISKNNVAFSKTQSSKTGTVYSFTDLEPATYVLEYSTSGCTQKLYDTVVVAPYSYPTQAQSAIYQCDNNTLSLGTDVAGGIGPFTYQIIGSQPETPSINTELQTSPLFAINTGTVYSLVRLRAIDACGNATLDDASVLPLQNIIITADRTCFYQNITLSVARIPNATYKWYRKTSLSDSTLVGDSVTFNIPFFQPEQVGEYVCVVDVNNGCLIRYSSFRLDGDCGNTVLANSVQLNGTAVNAGNQLSWNAGEDAGIRTYTIERSPGVGSPFKAIGKVPATTGNSRYMFIDQNAGGGRNAYRLKMIDKDQKFSYSNVVFISAKNRSVVYPNPVREQLHIELNSEKDETYSLELFDFSGRKLYSHQLRTEAIHTSFVINRDSRMAKGIYLLRVRQQATGETETHRIIFN
jgi:hypothetical protein